MLPTTPARRGRRSLAHHPLLVLAGVLLVVSAVLAGVFVLGDARLLRTTIVPDPEGGGEGEIVFLETDAVLVHAMPIPGGPRVQGILEIYSVPNPPYDFEEIGSRILCAYDLEVFPGPPPTTMLQKRPGSVCAANFPRDELLHTHLVAHQPNNNLHPAYTRGEEDFTWDCLLKEPGGPFFLPFKMVIHGSTLDFATLTSSPDFERLISRKPANCELQVFDRRPPLPLPEDV